MLEGPEDEPTEEPPIVPRVGKALYKYDLTIVSYLTLGGYDSYNFVGNLTWYDTSECVGGWNLTSDVVTLGGEDIIPYPGDETIIEFQTAYPYIGVPDTTWAQVKEIVSNANLALNSTFTCGGDTGFNQYCYWKGTTCDQLDLTAEFVV